MGGGVIVTRVSDQRWLVGGDSVAPPPGVDAILYVLEHAVRAGGGVVPLTVEVRELGITLRLIVRADGSVTTEAAGAMTRALLRWLRPAGSVLVAVGEAARVPYAAGDVLQRVADRVDVGDWEAVATHAYERSVVEREARSLRVTASAYRAALGRVREVAQAVAREVTG